MTKNPNDPCSVWKFHTKEDGSTLASSKYLPTIVYEGRRVDCEAYRDGALSRNSLDATFEYRIAEVSDKFEG